LSNESLQVVEALLINAMFDDKYSSDHAVFPEFQADWFH